jgi:hypothetical protein
MLTLMQEQASGIADWAIDLDEGVIGKKLKTSRQILDALQQSMHDHAYNMDVSTGAQDAEVWQKRVQNSSKILDKVEQIATQQAGDKKETKFKSFFNELSLAKKRLNIECTDLVRDRGVHTENVKNKGKLQMHFTIVARDLLHLDRQTPRARIKKTPQPPAPASAP